LTNIKEKWQNRENLSEVLMVENAILNTDGTPVEVTEITPASREQVAVAAHNIFMESPESETYMMLLVQHAIDQGVDVTDGKLSLSVKDPMVQDFALGYASQKIIDNAVNENLTEAYSLLLRCTAMPKFLNKTNEGLILTDNDLTNLSVRFSSIPELTFAQKVCENQSEILSTLNGTSGKVVTSYHANRLQEKFEDIAEYLNFEQKAAGYYNVSLVHRLLLNEKNDYDPRKANSEKECLKKVLENTSDYKRIKYCLNRLGSDYSNHSGIRAAYRRALTATDVPTDLYKINYDLARSYLTDFKPSVGFLRYEQEAEKLQRAEMYFADALEYAQDTEKLDILKNIAKLQSRQGKTAEWTATETQIAMEHLDGTARVHLLMKIAMKNANLKTPYLERALVETTSSKEIEKSKKANLVRELSGMLRTIYQKENNEAGLEKLARISSKYKNQDVPENPLDLYKRRSR